MDNKTNGRTPEEIKRGLESCKPVWVDNHWKTCDAKCPYIDDVGGFCRAQLMADALALIQQLERERDAAVGLVKELGTCTYCKHDSFCPHTIPDCMNCKDERCPCYSCGHQSNWQWRGIQEEAHDET